jgi:hypothetical protein
MHDFTLDEQSRVKRYCEHMRLHDGTSKVVKKVCNFPASLKSLNLN